MLYFNKNRPSAQYSGKIKKGAPQISAPVDTIHGIFLHHILYDDGSCLQPDDMGAISEKTLKFQSHPHIRHCTCMNEI